MQHNALMLDIYSVFVGCQQGIPLSTYGPWFKRNSAATQPNSRLPYSLPKGP
jgi:hypothetical protein